MRTEFQEILNQVQAKVPATRIFEAESITYTRNFRPSERLILLDCGHIAQPVCRYAANLCFSVTVADNRPSFANHTRFPEAEHVICDSFSHAIRQVQIKSFSMCGGSQPVSSAVRDSIADKCLSKLEGR